jgi:ATP-dependent RNA helicase DeaD
VEVASTFQTSPVEPGGGEATQATEVEGPPRARLFVGVGEQDGVDDAKVRAWVEANAPGTELVAVELRRSHVFLEVKPEAADPAVQALNGKELGGKAPLVEKARRRRR